MSHIHVRIFRLVYSLVFKFVLCLSAVVMHSKQLTAFILVCIFYVTTVQARDDLRKNLFQESFQKRDSLSESQEKQERSYASNIHGLLLADRK